MLSPVLAKPEAAVAPLGPQDRHLHLAIFAVATCRHTSHGRRPSPQRLTARMSLSPARTRPPALIIAHGPNVCAQAFMLVAMV